MEKLREKIEQDDPQLLKAKEVLLEKLLNNRTEKASSPYFSGWALYSSFMNNGVFFMVDVYLFSGFFGSGKTSLLVNVIQAT